MNTQIVEYGPSLPCQKGSQREMTMRSVASRSAGDLGGALGRATRAEKAPTDKQAAVGCAVCRLQVRSFGLVAGQVRVAEFVLAHVNAAAGRLRADAGSAELVSRRQDEIEEGEFPHFMTNCSSRFAS